MNSCAYTVGIVTIIVSLVPMGLGLVMIKQMNQDGGKSVGPGVLYLVIGLLLFSSGVATLCNKESFESLVFEYLGAPQIDQSPAAYSTPEGLAAYQRATTAVTRDAAGNYEVQPFEAPGHGTLLSIDRNAIPTPTKEQYEMESGQDLMFPGGTRFAFVPHGTQMATAQMVDDSSAPVMSIADNVPQTAVIPVGGTEISPGQVQNGVPDVPSQFAPLNIRPVSMGTTM